MHLAHPVLHVARFHATSPRVGVLMAALLDARTGQVIPGYEAANNTVIRGVDGPAIELRWGDATTAALAPGREVRLRFTIRDAVLYSVGTTTASSA